MADLAGKGVGDTHQFGRFAALTQPSTQRFIGNLRADFAAQAKGVHDGAGSVVNAEGVRIVHRDLAASEFECGAVEGVPSHGGGRSRSPCPPRKGDVVGRWDDVS